MIAPVRGPTVKDAAWRTVPCRPQRLTQARRSPDRLRHLLVIGPEKSSVQLPLLLSTEGRYRSSNRAPMPRETRFPVRCTSNSSISGKRNSPLDFKWS